MSCESCIDEARERMRDLDNLKEKAKKHAKEANEPMAICKDPGGYFLTTAREAINNGCAIVEILSNL